MDAKSKLALIGAAATVVAATVPPLVSLLRPAAPQSTGPTIGAITQGAGGTVQMAQTINNHGPTNTSVVNNYTNAWVQGARTIFGAPEPLITIPNPSAYHGEEPRGVSPPASEVPNQSRPDQTTAQPLSRTSNRPPVDNALAHQRYFSPCALACVDEGNCSVQDASGTVTTLSGVRLLERCDAMYLIRGAVEVLSVLQPRMLVTKRTAGARLLEPSAMSARLSTLRIDELVSCPTELPCGSVSEAAVDRELASWLAREGRIVELQDGLYRTTFDRISPPLSRSGRGAKWSWRVRATEARPELQGEFEVIAIEDRRQSAVVSSMSASRLERLGVMLEHDLRWEAQLLLGRRQPLRFR